MLNPMNRIIGVPSEIYLPIIVDVVACTDVRCSNSVGESSRSWYWQKLRVDFEKWLACIDVVIDVWTVGLAKCLLRVDFLLAVHFSCRYTRYA
jgi:hypothetical protein